MNKFKKKQKGFTLMELMIAVAIMAIMISMSVISYEKMSFRTGIRSLSNDIAGVLTQARLNAMTNGETVSVCPVLNAFPPANESLDNVSFPPDGAVCQPWIDFEPGTANNQLGFIVFKDPQGDGIMTFRTSLILRVPFDDRNGKVGISKDSDKTTLGNASTASAGDNSGAKKNAVRFNRKGMLASTAGTIVITSNDSTEYKGDGYDRGVVLAPNTGRITNKSL